MHGLLLRESGEKEGREIEVGALAGSGESGVAHGRLVVQFVDAALGFEPPSLEDARSALTSAAGAAATVDAAAVIATFQRMNRFTDATGIPLDTTTEIVSRDIRAELGAESFATAANTPRPGLLRRALGPVFRPFTRLGLWWMARR